MQPLLEPVADPEPSIAYPDVLGRGRQVMVRCVVGLLIGISGYLLVVPVVAQLVLGLGYLVRRPNGGFTAYYGRAMAYHLPEGLAATHIALATLIPLSIALVWGWHRVRPRWLLSVQPGLRWRYLVGCLAIAAVALNLVMWVSEWASGGWGGWGHFPQWTVPAQAWLWVVFVLVLSPLQAAGEEFFFRGYMLQAIGGITRNRWAAVVVTALVFALFHGVQNIWLFIDRFAFGLLAGALVVVTGGIEAGIAAHVANNVFAFGYAIFSGGAARAKGVTQITASAAVWDVAGFAVTAALCWWFGRRLNVAHTTPAITPGRI
ncbi:CPBP family intramembrane glutamic endopeptidase [Aestuariimicrobium kwangyangense]|uniref:CPBP family intramembrane glutamic endopeptidase n=1 Tax=Aestuariimicrobium kwangyangense TaxID=396389 RepID=UPI0003B4D43F|nr:type II CAAX endopeptidase family protein [Aestuariimicrobium kwangyangense]